MSDSSAQNSFFQEGEKERHVRFERLAENFTYIAIVGGVILSLLPYQFPIERRNLYAAIVLISFFAITWFRLIPKKYSGELKNFIYAFFTIIFISAVVHFTRGVLSVTIFLYYLTSIAVASSMALKQTIIITSLAVLLIGFESIFGWFQPDLGVKSLSMAILHIWGLVMTTSYVWLIFQEENRAKAREERAKVDKVEAISKVKNELVFIVSSKLREPILTLQQYLQKATNLGIRKNPEQEDLLAKTLENSDRLERLVGDLSDLGKIETGRMRLDLKDVDISQVVGATLSDFTFAAHEKNIKLNYQVPKKKFVAKADSSRIHEILANLVDNAIKYSTTGKEIQVTIGESDGFVQIAVKDQGFGIPQDSRQHLFEKFYRVDRADRVEAKGTGLGLFISKQLVDRQGGKIWFDTEEGRGTTFYFTLPQANG